MNKIFTCIAFFTFITLCIHSIYENNATLFAGDEAAVLSVVRIETADEERKVETERIMTEEDYLKALDIGH